MKQCPAKNCSERIPEGIVFCANHWNKLPIDLKKKLIKHFPIASIVLQEQPGKNYTEYLRQAVGCLELKEKSKTIST